MNNLFEEDGLSGSNMLNYANTIMGKVSENEMAMVQVNNTKEQVMLGQFPEAIQNAIIESMDTQNTMAMKALSSEAVAKSIASLVFDMMMRSAEGAKAI